MKQRVLVALLTVLVFASGFAARVWTEDSLALPPPPAPIGSEFAPQASAAHPPAPDAKKPADHRAQLIADIQKLGPQIAMFQAKSDELYAEFDRDFIAILNPDQRQHYADTQKKHAVKAPKSTGPLSDEEIEHDLNRPLYILLGKVAVAEKLRVLTERCNLDAAQQAQVHDLLLAHREKFLALVDSVPPYSVQLSRIAPDVQKLAQPGM
jgi:hypothetical protein